ncbi:phenoloxidase-activating factor 2-like [Leptopilina heterotoma]|uniref:phenoloxidase-activating factor 2-like n=1 Tax=Leptopilina heterotoma TaxID=63436 RepID=UPI001CA9B2FB|nr:phenoloxidase-activating factor 2-like [Leptopilina heterotoma]
MKKVVILIFAYFLSEAVGFTDIFYDLDQVSQIRKRQIPTTVAPGTRKPQANPMPVTTTTMSPVNVKGNAKPPTNSTPKPQQPPPTPATTDNRLTPVPSKNPTFCRCISSTSVCDGMTVEDNDNSKYSPRIVNNDQNPWCPPNKKRCCTEKSCGVRLRIDQKPKPNYQAYYGEYPWHAEIIDLKGNTIGAGVIINETSVLTVAHKVYNLNNQYQIRLGKFDRMDMNEKSLTVKPILTRVHEKFDPESLDNDIAVININEIKIMFQDYYNINSACLPEKDFSKDFFLNNTLCSTAGWGAVEFKGENNAQYEQILKKVNVALVDAKTCESKLQKTRLGADFRLNDKSFLCAGGEKGKDSCTGDGGGALVCLMNSERFVIAGLTAWGVGCGQSDVPGVYVNVLNYRNWINGIKEPSKSKFDVRSMF